MSLWHSCSLNNHGEAKLVKASSDEEESRSNLSAFHELPFTALGRIVG